MSSAICVVLSNKASRLFSLFGVNTWSQTDLNTSHLSTSWIRGSSGNFKNVLPRKATSSSVDERPMLRFGGFKRTSMVPLGVQRFLYAASSRIPTHIVNPKRGPIAPWMSEHHKGITPPVQTSLWGSVAEFNAPVHR